MRRTARPSGPRRPTSARHSVSDLKPCRRSAVAEYAAGIDEGRRRAHSWARQGLRSAVRVVANMRCRHYPSWCPASGRVGQRSVRKTARLAAEEIVHRGTCWPPTSHVAAWARTCQPGATERFVVWRLPCLQGTSPPSRQILAELRRFRWSGSSCCPACCGCRTAGAGTAGRTGSGRLPDGQRRRQANCSAKA